MGQLPANPARRAFLRGSTKVEAVMRPPWALPEAAFVEACQACGDCVRACPEGVLRIGAGGFPQVDFSAGACTFCQACVAGCVPQALTPGRPEPWSWRAGIDDACLTGLGVHCQSCRDSCPERAIRFPPTAAVPRPELDPARCTACGACVGACPAGAIGMRPVVLEAA